LLAATEANAVVTRAFTGRPARSVRNRFVEEHLRAGLEPLAWPLQGVADDDVYKEAMGRGQADLVPLYAGQGLRMLNGVKDAAEIVRELMEEARDILSRLGDGAPSERA
jgi:nitronate monooxygenase